MGPVNVRAFAARAGVRCLRMPGILYTANRFPCKSADAFDLQAAQHLTEATRVGMSRIRDMVPSPLMVAPEMPDTEPM